MAGRGPRREMCALMGYLTHIFFCKILGEKHYQSFGNSGHSDSTWLLPLSAQSGLFTTHMTSAVYRFTVHTNVMRYWAVGDHYLPVVDTR